MTAASKAADIRSYSFQSRDRLLLDANIWLLVYGPVGNDWRIPVYSKALKAIRNVQSTIYLDVLVLSEFINAFARLEYNQSSSKPADFKTFRKSPAFKPIAQDIALNARKIVKQCQCCESGFSTVDLTALLTEFELGDSDFNDQMIARICLTKGLKLVTDDGDFKCPGLNVITANRRLVGPP